MALTTVQSTFATGKKLIDPFWILCDNEPTDNLFKNKDILMNIRKGTIPIRLPIRLQGIEGNMIEIDEEGYLTRYGNVYYHLPVTATVVSFFNLDKRFKSMVYSNQKKDAL